MYFLEELTANKRRERAARRGKTCRTAEVPGEMLTVTLGAQDWGGYLSIEQDQGMASVLMIAKVTEIKSDPEGENRHKESTLEVGGA